MNKITNKGSAWSIPKAKFVVLIIALFLSAQRVEAQADGNPLTGYDSTTSYFLDYSSGSFLGGASSDVQVDVTIAGDTHPIDVDTGSRGIYMSSDELGSDFNPNVTGTYTGQIDLDSSGRVASGNWVPTTVSFNVTNQNNVQQTVTSSVNLLDVTTLSAQLSTGNTVTSAFYGTSITSGSIVLNNGGTVPIVQNTNTGAYGVYLTNTGTGVLDQQISYANNLKPDGSSKINSVSNFGIGFDVGGAPGRTEPVAPNQNQIYNPLINVNPTVTGSYVQGYIVTPTGIQLGLTSADTGYAYTSLNSTGLASTNSVPDWQTPLGQTVTHGIVNAPGSIVMDSGIPQAFISAHGLTNGDVITGPMSVYLINSGGAVAYNIDVSGTATNYLNPEYVSVVPAGTKGTYTQTQPPYQDQFFNTGRNVFEGFNMLYDAQDGYVGLSLTDYGLQEEMAGDISFTPGYYADPIPESQSTAVMLLALVVYMLRSMKVRNRSRVS